MPGDNFEGQMDFLGMLSSYTDDQGAKVVVRDPGVRRRKPDKANSYEQISMDFTIKDPEEAFLETKTDKTVRSEIKIQEVETEAEREAKEKAEAEAIAKAEAKAKARAEAEAKAKAKAEAEARAKVEEESRQKVVEKKPKKKTSEEKLFKACDRCWCYDCKHNARNEGVPRDICGMMMACPACKGCEEEDCPTICEIGNAKEGCRTRAMEEGISIEG